jgi:hypothetical protein
VFSKKHGDPSIDLDTVEGWGHSESYYITDSATTGRVREREKGPPFDMDLVKYEYTSSKQGQLDAGSFFKGWW